MITKKKVGEAVLRAVMGGSTKPELKVKIQDAMLASAQARDAWILQFFSASKMEGYHTFPFDILSTYELVVSNSKVTLPRRGLSVLKHNSGIYRVVTTDCNHPQELIPTRRGSDTLYSGQVGAALEGRPSYFPLRQDLYVKGVQDGCVLLVDYVVAGEEFGLDEFFCIPPEAETEVINLAISRMSIQAQTPEDLYTDSKSNQ
jgi:hypothetical protein